MQLDQLTGPLPSARKEIYLTFDDGPSPLYTPLLLDLLAEFAVKATFFVVGRFAEENPQIIARMVREGHQIGLHSLEHISAYLQPPGYPRQDFARSVEILKQQGITPRFYRPPWGHTRPCTRGLASRYGLQIVLWTVMAEDWKKSSSAEQIASRLLQRTKSGDIVCLHDGRGRDGAPGRTIEALRQVLPVWIEQGYTFPTIEQAACMPDLSRAEGDCS